jgi:queuosine precursor transporter
MTLKEQAIMEPRTYRFYDLFMGLSVTVLMLSNLLSSAKLIDMGINLAGLELAFDAGTLVFPIGYIFNNILTEVYGYRRSRRVIWMGFLAVILMAFYVWLTGVLPPQQDWAEEVGQEVYYAVLGGISGLVVASVSAYLMGEFTNSYVLAKMKILTRGRWVWSRTIGSTVVGQAVDTLTFFAIATALGVFPPFLFVTLVVTNYLIKVSVEVILTPITLRIIAFLKKTEGEDYYDYDTNFNPFRLDM